MEKMDIDYLVEYPFDDQVRRMAPEDFVVQILSGRMKAAAIVVGPDCSFGYQGAGNAELLRKLAASCGYSLYVIKKSRMKTGTGI